MPRCALPTALVCLFSTLSLSAPALGQTTVEVSSLSADGQEVRDLSCSLSGGGLFASMLVMAALAQEKEALDACAPAGAAFAASWRWGGGGTHDIAISAASVPNASGCVERVLAGIASDMTGTCSAVVLVGESAAAGAAADALVVGESSPDK